MKTESEIKEAQEQIKLQLTQAETEREIGILQGQYTSLDWVLYDNT